MQTSKTNKGKIPTNSPLPIIPPVYNNSNGTFGLLFSTGVWTWVGPGLLGDVRKTVFLYSKVPGRGVGVGVGVFDSVEIPDLGRGAVCGKGLVL